MQPTSPPPVPTPPPLPGPSLQQQPAPGPPLRDRLPEIAATIGVVLIATAVIGFVVSTWGQLNAIGQAGVVAGFSAALTVGGVQLETLNNRFLSRVTSLVFMAGSITAAAAVTLAAQAALPDAARATIALGGTVAALHALWVYLRDTGAPARAVTVGLALLYAVGPPGTGINDRFSTVDLDLVPYLATSLLGNAPVGNVDLLLPGVLWMLVGVALLWWANVHAEANVRRPLATLAGLTFLGATLMLNAVDSPVGPAVALGVIIGFVLYGVTKDDTFIVLLGSGAGVIAMFRVAFGIFSGQVAATIITATLGVVLLVYATYVAKRRVADEPDER